MQDKIEELIEKITNLKEILGELNFEDLEKKQVSKLSSYKDKEVFKNIGDIINKLNNEIAENDSNAIKEVNKRFEKLAPLLNIERLTSEFTISENEMYAIVMTNYDDLENFLLNLKYISDNQKILDYDSIIDLKDKNKEINKLSTESIFVNNNINKIHENVDSLCKSYTESIDVINKKFDNYNKLLDAIEANNN